MDAAMYACPTPIGAGVSGARKVAEGDRRHCVVKLCAEGDLSALDKAPRGRLAWLFCLSLLEPVLAALEGCHDRRPCGAEAPRRRGGGGVPAACYCLILGSALWEAVLEAGVLRG